MKENIFLRDMVWTSESPAGSRLVQSFRQGLVVKGQNARDQGIKSLLKKLKHKQTIEQERN